MLIIFYFFLSFFLFFSFFSTIFWSFKNGITPSPTSKKQRKTLFKLIDDHLPKKLEGPILELGSGFFPLAYQTAKIFKENEVIAYETSLMPYLFSKLYLFFFPIKNLKILRQDFFRVSFHKEKLLLCYLYPAAMEKLKNKFGKELTKGAYIISNTFAIPNKEPEKVILTDDLYKTKIYLYKN